MSYDLGRLESCVKSLSVDIEKLSSYLLGDGRPGALERLVKIEKNLERATEISKNNSDSIKDLGESINDLKSIVNSHVKNSSLHSYHILLNPRVISTALIFITMVFVILHIIGVDELLKLLFL